MVGIMDLSVCFVAFGPRHLGSSRLRAWNVAEAWGVPCIVWDDEDLPSLLIADVFIVQKVYPQPHRNFATKLHQWVRQARALGKQVIWDLCDPIWYWMPDEEFRDLAALMSAVVVSSGGLQVFLEEDHGIKATVIEDRLPYQNVFKRHESQAVPTLVWFGYSSNRMPCFSAAALPLQRLLSNGIPFKLKIIDNAPEQQLAANSALASVTSHVRWSEDTFIPELLTSDIALLPPYPGNWGEMKSGNKMMTAAWSGLPVSDGISYTYLRDLVTNPPYRQTEGEWMRQWAETHYDVRQSVTEWMALCTHLSQPVQEER
mgnify:CR=1 FL=1